MAANSDSGKKTFARFTDYLGNLLSKYPAEMGFITFLTLIFLWNNHLWFSGIDYYTGCYTIQAFCLCFILNNLFRTRKLRILYYVSVIPACSLLFVTNTSSTVFVVSLVLGVLFVLLSRPCKGNTEFARQSFAYLTSLCTAFLLATAGLLITFSIFYSVEYIFDLTIPIVRDNRIVIFFYFWVFPAGFLYFDTKEIQPERHGKFAETFLNYILTPALLIYAAILYIYFVYIIVHRELPKGGLAAMVFAYCIAVVIANAFRLTLDKRLYGWFYDRLYLFSLPAVLMLWVGTLYRINAYGFTQARFYLLLCGLIMTFTVLMPSVRKLNRYSLAVWISAGLLILFTFIPGITAWDIGIRAQARRYQRYLKELDLLNDQNRLRQSFSYSELDERNGRALSELLEVQNYLRSNGYAGLPENYEMLSRIHYGDPEPEYYFYPEGSRVTLQRKEPGLELTGGWSRVFPLSDRRISDRYHASINQDNEVIVYNERGNMVFHITFDEILKNISGRVGKPIGEITGDDLEDAGDRIFEFETGKEKVIFSTFHFMEYDDQRELKLTDAEPAYFLTR